MTLKQGIILFFSLSLWACASLNQSLPKVTVEPWIVVPSSTLNPAYLRHHDSKGDLKLDFDHAGGFVCYSPDDDLIWRNRMSALEAIQASP